MERWRLGSLLKEAGLAPDLANRPDRALALLEARAERAEESPPCTPALIALVDRLSASADPPPPLDPSSAELVRWDAISATFVGAPREGSLPALVRALRPHIASSPQARRHMIREQARLEPLIGAQLAEGADKAPLILVPLPGEPLPRRRGDALVRPLLTGLSALARWESHGLGLPWLLPEEMRLVGGEVHITCAEPAPPPLSLAIASLADALVDPIDDSALATTVRALALHPPETVADADRIIRAALAENLTARRHDLAARWQQTWHRNQESRLYDAVERLYAALGPPEGRGAVSVDLEGRITVVESDPRQIRWGPERAAEAVFDREEGFYPIVARRLLRARAVSPPNPSLDARIGGSPQSTDAICRWVAAGLKLRTVRMLLARDRT